MKSSTDRVLIVDDEPAIRKMLEVMLSQAGIANQSAANAPAALDALPDGAFSAVISDLHMPGTSGLELLAEVRIKYPELVFLVATGVDDVRVGVQAMKEGADDYLVKPFQVEVVLSSLERAFQKKALQRELENYRHHLEEMIAERTQQLHMAIAQLAQSVLVFHQNCARPRRAGEGTAKPRDGSVATRHREIGYTRRNPSEARCTDHARARGNGAPRANRV
jgi:DNA-binding NtrC family response regulator